MAFVRRRGTTWYACWASETGTQVQRATKARTKSECQRLADELERKAERVRLGVEDAVPDPVPLREVAEKYLSIVTKGQRSAKSTEGRVRRHVLPALGDRLIHQIRPVDIQELLVQKARDENLAPATCRHIRVHLHAIFEFARTSMRVLPRENPVDAVPQVRLPERVPVVLSEGQVRRLLEAGKEWQFLLRFDALTGLRKGELCGLRWGDLDLDARIIAVSRSYAGPTKSGKTRHVPIHSSLVAELKHLKVEATSELVFPGPRGEMRPRSWKPEKMFRAALKRAGLVSGYVLTCRRKGCGFVVESKEKVAKDCPRCGFALWPVGIPIAATLKSLRSTFGTLAYEATGDIRFVQENLGHADEETTKRHYAAQRAAHLVAQVDRIQDPASQVPDGSGESRRTGAK